MSLPLLERAVCFRTAFARALFRGGKIITISAYFFENKNKKARCIRIFIQFFRVCPSKQIQNFSQACVGHSMKFSTNYFLVPMKCNHLQYFNFIMPEYWGVSPHNLELNKINAKNDNIYQIKAKFM